MSTPIDWSTLTGSKTLADGGYAGDLMAIARAHIDDAIKTGRLTQKDAGQVYTSMIPAAISSAASFILNDAMQTAQILGIEQDNLIKQQQVLIAQQELALKTKQLELETYRLLNTMPAELADITSSTTLKNSQNAEVLSSTTRAVAESAKKVLLTQEQIESENKQNEVDGVIDKQKLDITAATTLKTYENTVLQVDQHTTNTKQQDMLTQQKLTEVQHTAQVAYEVATLLPDQHTTNTKQQDMLDAERAKVLQDTTLAKRVPLLNSQLSAWTAAFNGGKIDNVPSILDNTAIVSTYDSIKTL